MIIKSNEPIPMAYPPFAKGSQKRKVCLKSFAYWNLLMISNIYYLVRICVGQVKYLT
jgi:hypothetical protein